MKTDTEIRIDGTKALMDALGELQTERFIVLIGREPFDYTRWQKNMWAGTTVKETSAAAMKHRDKLNQKSKC